MSCSQKKRRRVKIYISKPLDYPEVLYQEIKNYIEYKNYIVDTWDKTTPYTVNDLLKADVVLFLSNDMTPILEEDNSFGFKRVIEEIGRGQHTEFGVASKANKLCITFGCFKDEVLYIYETKNSKVSNKGEAYWGQGYAYLTSKYYGSWGAEFSDFVSGNMSTERKILHDFCVKNSSLKLLLLVNNS